MMRIISSLRAEARKGVVEVTILRQEADGVVEWGRWKTGAGRILPECAICSLLKNFSYFFTFLQA